MNKVFAHVYHILQADVYYSYKVSLQVIQTSICMFLWLVILWGAKNELYLTIALFRGSLSWSFLIIAIKNNLHPFLNLSFWSPENSHLSIKAVGNHKVSNFIGNTKLLKWIWCFKIIHYWPEGKHFHKSPQKIIICITQKGHRMITRLEWSYNFI